MKRNELGLFQECPYHGARNIHWKIRWFLINIKWSWQRIYKGYCDYDCWQLNTYYAAMFKETLRHLANTTHSVPAGFYDPKCNESGKWEKYLNDAADCFENYLKEVRNPFEDRFTNYAQGKLKLSKENGTPRVLEGFFKANDEIYEWKMNELDKGLTMVKDHWDNLWD